MQFLKKAHTRHAFCALCRGPRQLKYERKMAALNYIQIFVLGIFTTWLMFGWWEWKGLASLFVWFAGFDLTRKTLYRRELPCPHCGFDATWYKRDVRVARRQVEDFIKQNPGAAALRNRKAAEEKPTDIH